MSRDGAIGIIFDQSKTKVLLILRGDIPLWALPGGRSEPGEKLEDTCKREVFEETGYSVDVVREVGKYHFTIPKRVVGVYECIIVGGFARTSQESVRVEFFDIERLPAITSPYSSAYIQDALYTNGKELRNADRPAPNFGLLKTTRGALKHPLIFLLVILSNFGIHFDVTRRLKD